MREKDSTVEEIVFELVPMVEKMFIDGSILFVCKPRTNKTAAATMGISQIVVTHEKHEARVFNLGSNPFSHLFICVGIIVKVIEVVSEEDAEIKILLLFEDTVGNVPLQMYVRDD